MYHGWLFNGAGQCTDQPAEEKSFAAKIRIRSYPTREYLGLIFAYFGAGEAPPFPLYPHMEEDGVLEVLSTEVWPCNFFQRIDNNGDTYHVPFVHRGAYSASSANNRSGLPEISKEESPWGTTSYASFAQGWRNVFHFFMPNVYAFRNPSPEPECGSEDRMGLVGFVLGPMVSQISVDYLKTWMFAMRPLLWLSLMARTKGTISFSPSFGYQLCVKRLRRDAASTFDLGAWRVAGVGAETIQSAALAEFANVLEPSGFKPNAFLACYGMAEASLAVSFAPLHQGITVDRVDPTALSERGLALALNGRDSGSEVEVSNTRPFVVCGVPLPGVQVEIRDEQGRVLPDRHAGVIFLRGANMRQTQLLKSLVTRLTDSLQSVKPLKAMAREELVGSLLGSESKRLNRALRQDVISTEALSAAQDLTMGLIIVSGLYVALIQWKLPFNAVLVMILVLARSLASLGKTQRQYQKMKSYESAFWSLQAVIEDASRARETNPQGPSPRLENSVRLNNVSFGYGKIAVLGNASLTVPARSFTAIMIAQPHRE